MTWWRRVLRWLGFGRGVRARTAASHAHLLRALDELDAELRKARKHD